MTTTTVDRSKKVRELEEQVARVREEIAEEEERERRVSLFVGAFDKLKKVLVGCLTEEERQAVNGMYLFLHIDGAGTSLNVDMVRNLPSATDKGQGPDLLRQIEW